VGPAAPLPHDIANLVDSSWLLGCKLSRGAAVMPGTTGYAVRTGGDAVRRTAGAVSATRSFLDDLRGRSRR